MFITFEGIDGVGKSTQAKRLYVELCKQEIEVILTHEPGGTPFGMRVREIIKTEPTLSLKSQFHLIEAQRAHHVDTVLLPETIKGTTVICDRFIDTSYVYQHDYMTKWDWQEYLETFPIVPDLTFLLWSNYIPKLKERMAARAGVEMDHFDNASIEKLKKMQDHFFELAYCYPRIVPINTDRLEDVVADDIWNHYIRQEK